MRFWLAGVGDPGDVQESTGFPASVVVFDPGTVARLIAEERLGRNKGICTLCGKGGPLTFEHVPPEASGNLRGVMMFNLEEWLARNKATGQMPGGIIQPEGMGLIALCDGCNSGILGKHYVPSFLDFVEAGKQMLGQVAPRIKEFNARVANTVLKANFLAVNRLAVAKQIIEMLLVTSGRDVVVANPALAEFVLNPTAQGLPDRYRLFIAITPGPAAKTTGVGGVTDFNTSEQLIAAELVYPPFAYALSFNGAAAYPKGEITHWACADVGAVVSEQIDLPLGFCHTAFLRDLRTEAQIEQARAAQRT